MCVCVFISLDAQAPAKNNMVFDPIQYPLDRREGEKDTPPPTAEYKLREQNAKLFDTRIDAAQQIKRTTAADDVARYGRRE